MATKGRSRLPRYPRNPLWQNARVELERALQGVIANLVGDHIELYQQFEETPSFKQWLSEVVFQATYQPPQG